jgi:hypothetical protein
MKTISIKTSARNSSLRNLHATTDIHDRAEPTIWLDRQSYLATISHRALGTGTPHAKAKDFLDWLIEGAVSAKAKLEDNVPYTLNECGGVLVEVSWSDKTMREGFVSLHVIPTYRTEYSLMRWRRRANAVDKQAA